MATNKSWYTGTGSGTTASIIGLGSGTDSKDPSCNIDTDDYRTSEAETPIVRDYFLKIIENENSRDSIIGILKQIRDGGYAGRNCLFRACVNEERIKNNECKMMKYFIIHYWAFDIHNSIHIPQPLKGAEGEYKI